MFPSRWPLIFLLLLTYTGQSLAAVGVPCQMMLAGPGDSMTMAGMDHSDHHMPASPDENSDRGDCCEDGYCSMSQCQTTTALLQLVPLVISVPVSGPINFDSSSFPPARSTALFRPPIFR